MEKTYVNPSDLPTPRNYHQVVSAVGGRAIYMSGQVALDRERNMVGAGDVAEQMRQAFRNIRMGLSAVGADLTDIVHITIHVVDYRPDQHLLIAGVISEFFPEDQLPANTFVAVPSLTIEGLLVEITPIAHADAPAS